MRRGRPERWRRCSRCARAGACRPRSSGGSPTTATSRSWSAAGRRGWRARRPGAGADPGRALTSDAIVHDRPRPRPTHRAARRRPGAPDAPARACRSGAWIRARSCSRCSARQPRQPRMGHHAVRRDGRRRHGRRAAGAAPRSCASRARPRRSWRRPTPGASARHDPWLGAALAVAEAPATWRSPGPDRWASRTASTSATRPARRRSGASPRASAGWPTRAGRSGCRSPAATSALQRVADRGRSRRRPRSASSACSTTWRRSSVRPSRQADDVVLLVGEACRAWQARRTPTLAGSAAEDGPPALDLAREAALQRSPRGDRARGLLASAQDVSGGGLAVALAECAIWAGLGAPSASASPSAGGRPVRREPVAAGPVTAGRGYAAALALLARQHGLPIETHRVGRRRAPGHRARRGGATGAAEERGGGVADALDVAVARPRHAWDTALPRALGWEG